MQIASTKRKFQPVLKKLAEDPKVAAAVTPGLESILPAPDKRHIDIQASSSLIVSSALPTCVRLPSVIKAERTDYETVMTIVQELVMPAFGDIWPSAKPYIKGVLAIWASSEFFDAITDENADSTQKSIKGVKAAHKIANVFLHFQNAPALSITTNNIAGYFVATADQLYVVQEE